MWAREKLYVQNVATCFPMRNWTENQTPQNFEVKSDALGSERLSIMLQIVAKTLFGLSARHATVLAIAKCKTS
jgi:hypothetical protein